MISNTTPSRLLRSAIALFGALLIASSVLAAPKILKKVPPEFPREAAKKNVNKGTVNARMSIGPDGKVTEVTITEALPPRLFDRAVIDALMEWRFEGTGEKQTHDVKLVFTNED
jgi:protein TonB